MMKANPNVIKGTNRPDLYKSLVKIQEELVKCEKVLAQYLETKRLTYPRFYFISPADLLDILSNGNNPEAVCKYVFDQAALGHLDVGTYPPVHVIHHTPCSQALDQAVRLDGKVEVLEGQNGGRYDRQGRRIRRVFPKLRVFRTGKKTIASSLPTPHPPPTGGSSNVIGNRQTTFQVEKWLNRLTDAMRISSRKNFDKAVKSYDDRPRTLWIFDYPAQTSLCGNQIWWTTETNEAFVQLEAGHENSMKDYNKKQVYYSTRNTYPTILLLLSISSSHAIHCATRGLVAGFISLLFHVPAKVYYSCTKARRRKQLM